MDYMEMVKNNMPINKEYIFNYLGDEIIESIFEHFFNNVQSAYKVDMDMNMLEPETTLRKYIDDYIFGDMGFQYAESYDELDDFLFKQLGNRYKLLRDLYDVYYEYLVNRFPKFRIPFLQEVILDKAFWKPLERFVYEVNE
jgi:hypothetical protein